jgi:hypothetical protein
MSDDSWYAVYVSTSFVHLGLRQLLCIKNRVPSFALSTKHQTPVSLYMLVYGQKPSSSNLHPFGSLCWVYVSKQQSTGWKLSARGLHVFFLALVIGKGERLTWLLTSALAAFTRQSMPNLMRLIFLCRPAGYRRIHNLDLNLSSTSTEHRHHQFLIPWIRRRCSHMNILMSLSCLRNHYRPSRRSCRNCPTMMKTRLPKNSSS